MGDQRSGVFIATPSRGDFKPYFVESVMQLVRPETSSHAWRWALNLPVDIARNKLGEWFLESGFSHIFMMDTDMMFPSAALARLMRMDVPIASGLYFSRNENVFPHAYHYSSYKDNEHHYYPMGKEFVEWLAAHPDRDKYPAHHCFEDDWNVEADAVGAGCLLIKREVFEAIEPPWFEAVGATGGGEDFDFCRKAKAAGFDITVNMSVQCQHELTPVFVNRQDFEARFRPFDEDGYKWDRKPPTVEGGGNDPQRRGEAEKVIAVAGVGAPE